MLSKVDILKDKILKDISSGRLNPGDALPSRQQFMRRYKCARGSIDAAITSLSKGGYLFSRQGAGTYVAEHRNDGIIKKVFVVDDGRPGFESPFVQAGRLAAEIQRDIPCHVYAPDDVNVNLSMIMQPGSGVIWMRPSYSQLMVMNYLSNAGIPQVLVGRTYGNFGYITTDAKLGIAEGLAWLNNQPGEGMALISRGDRPDLPYAAERQVAFYESCTEQGIVLSPEWLFQTDTIDQRGNLNRIADSLFVGENCPERIFLLDVSVAFSLVTMAESRGKEVGRDYCLVTFDEESRLKSYPGIGMLRQRWEKMWNLAVKWVVSNPVDKEYKQKIKPEFIEGEG